MFQMNKILVSQVEGHDSHGHDSHNGLVENFGARGEGGRKEEYEFSRGWGG